MSKKPNIVMILADDMGYGDVRALNENCAFPTPNLDRLATGGLRFTDAHSSSAVCTPSRYSLLTGRYCWRTWLKRGVLEGVGQALIPTDRPTIANLCKDAGYNSACIGKWHLGWDWAVRPGMESKVNTMERDGNLQEWIDFSRPVANGPTLNGFDEFYGISGSLDMPPYVFVHNDMPVEVPQAWGTRMEFMAEGPRMQSLRANFVLGHLTDKAVEYINNQNSETPFLLYLPITAPHLPIAPAPEFIGKSGVNPYCDFCMEVDYRVGQILDTLEGCGFTDDTLVVFTSDNGVAPNPTEVETLERRYNHYCSFDRRGYKTDVWDGGHRVPFLMRWPRRITAGTSCDQAVGIYDLFATISNLLDIPMSADVGEDSVSLLPAFDGDSLDPDGRRGLIHHSGSGSFAIRHGGWKLLRCPGSGGWNFPDPVARKAGLPEIQLYDMASDAGERDNLVYRHPEKVRELTGMLHQAVVSGRTTPGSPQSNDPLVPLEDWDGVVWLSEIPEQYVKDD